MIVDIENWLWKSNLGTFCNDFLTVCLKVGENERNNCLELISEQKYPVNWEAKSEEIHT